MSGTQETLVSLSLMHGQVMGDEETGAWGMGHGQVTAVTQNHGHGEIQVSNESAVALSLVCPLDPSVAHFLKVNVTWGD